MESLQLANLSMNGGDGLDIVSHTKLYLSSDPQSAEKYLQNIKDNIPVLLKELKEREKDRECERNSLIAEEKELMRQKGKKERELSGLKEQIKSFEIEKAQHKALLEDAKRSLENANKLKKTAESEKDAAIAGTVGGGIGAAALGVVFPLSLLVTAPAVATAGTISITKAAEEIDRCSDNIRSAENNVASENRRITETNKKITSVEKEISTMKKKEQALHIKIGEKRKSILFFQKAATFMGKLIVAINGGRNEVDLLHTIVAEASKEEEYEILRADGCKIIVKTFAEAWKEVESKMRKGESFGFLSIKSA